MIRTRHAPALVLLAAGCAQDDLHIRLDVNKNCNEVEIETVVSEVDVPDGTLLDAAMDPQSPALWVLVAVDGAPGVQVRRIVDGAVDFTTAITTPIAPGTARLRASPDPEQVWVVAQAPGSFRLWRIDPLAGSAGQQGSQELAAFPHDTFTCVPCDTTEWYRDLVFLEQRPYVISVPPLSPNAAVSIWVGTLVAAPPDTGAIEVGTEHRLNFERTCTPTGDPYQDEACEASKSLVSYPEITVLGRQIDPRPDSARLLVQRERAEQTVPGTFADIFVVSLALDLDGIPQGILRSYQDPWQATTGPPHGLAVDEFASYVLYTTQYAGTRFLRLPSPPGELDFEDLTEQVPEIDPQTHVLQLDADIGIGRLVDGRWEITKVFPDALERSRTTTYTAGAPIEGVRAIGGGIYLLDEEGGAREVVRVRCLEPG